MTKSRMTYIVVLVAVLLVLIWDKTSNRDSITQPSSAQAYARQKQPQAESAARHVAGQTTNSASSVNRLHGALSEQAGQCPQKFFTREDAGTDGGITLHQREIRDLFTASQVFLDALQKMQPQTQQDETSMETEVIKQLQLKATMIRLDKSCAMINDEVIFVGGYIGHYRLVEVRHDRAVLQGKNDTIITLYFDD